MKVVKRAFVDTIPVMAGYIVLGIGFGMLAKSNGYGIGLALAMSLFIYAGSMQYVAVGLLTGGASYITVALTTLMVNARHLFYGISMVDRYKGAGAKKPYIIFALTDETYSLVCTDHSDMSDKDRFSYYFLTSIMDQSYWVTGSLIGAVLGTILKINTEGIDFSLTALFLTVMTDQWLKTKNHIGAIIGLAASTICLVIVGPDNFLIPAMVLIVVLLVSMKKFIEKEVD